MVENKDYFLKKWKDQIESKDVLKRVFAKRFIAIFRTAKLIDQFDVDLYYKLVEKTTVFDGRLVVSLLDGSGEECEVTGAIV